MNSVFSLLLTAFVLLCLSLHKTCESYIVVEAQNSDQILMNSLIDAKQIETNVLNTENDLKSRTFNANQTLSSLLVKQNAKPVNPLKSCSPCNKDKTQHLHTEYIQRLEYIKQQILSKLGMSKAPKLMHKGFETNNYMQVLEASSLVMSSAPVSETLKPEPLESDKIFIFPTVKRLNISQFNISVAKDLEFSFGINSIKKITLFVKQLSSHLNLDDNYIDKELTVISTAVPVNGVLTRYQDISNMRVLGIVNPQTNDKQSLPNWIQYDLTDIIKPEVINTNKLVSFDSESFDMKDSFITVEHNYNNVVRSRRSIDCTANSSSCCRESFYVNFTTIGWDNWILQPIGYNANYCRGKCDISNARYHHTTVIGKYPAISLCCSPREMSHISLIYLDDKGVVFQKNLANMVVESCDCA